MVMNSNRVAAPQPPVRALSRDFGAPRHDSGNAAKPAPTAAINVLPPPPAPGRCAEPGCVFPAWHPRTRYCHYHVVLETEAELFESCQPILEILALYMRFGPDPEFEEYDRQQKRMQAIVRDLFQRGVA